MEFNPIAINEVLAYSFLRKDATSGNPTPTPRFFIELVNVLTAPETGTADKQCEHPGPERAALRRRSRDRPTNTLDQRLLGHRLHR